MFKCLVVVALKKKSSETHPLEMRLDDANLRTGDIERLSFVVKEGRRDLGQLLFLTEIVFLISRSARGARRKII